MLTPSPSPSLLLELRQLLETDYAVPDLWDPDKQVLLDNDAYLHAQVEALKTGAALAAGSITDVLIGSRGILDSHTPPAAGAYDDTLTNHLRTLASRIKAIMGTPSWASGIPTTLAAALAHANDATGAAHGAVSAATPNAIVRRDASGQAQFGTPTHAAHAARKADVDALDGTLGAHSHDDRYYTKTQLGASGSYGSNVVHADRVSQGTLQAARIPNLAADKIVSGTFAPARVRTYGGSVNQNGASLGNSAGWTPQRDGVGLYRLVADPALPVPSVPGLVASPFLTAEPRFVLVTGVAWTTDTKYITLDIVNAAGTRVDCGFTWITTARA